MAPKQPGSFLYTHCFGVEGGEGGLRLEPPHLLPIHPHLCIPEALLTKRTELTKQPSSGSSLTVCECGLSSARLLDDH
ncbi:hypothetical protein AOXY_G25329 [Acipenser oxyrinchus oxyrinchus]|uniref:Uncharacterized protein n=1 Tax=Acipenser oxyrinchus oxyrinchus TaxID=40147 RepID=A0AAD8CSF9_ACIOX|nr:hypothetical protein AOXY_G25329 [Acipenser oxyrinchus oxyrinchus]